MRKIVLFIFLVFVNVICLAQLSKYDVTITYTTTPVGPWGTPNQTVQFCVTVDDFNQCAVAWFDGFQIEYGSGWATGSLTYDSDPSANWLDATQSIDEPAGWEGWSYNWSGNPNQTWNDYGVPGSGPWTFCFSLTTPNAGAPCWALNGGTGCDLSVDVSIWSDYDTGGWGSGCGTAGDPDGPYNISNFIVLPIELVLFEAELVGNNVDLTWVSASEMNNSHYTIERSIDANNWTVVGIKDGAGNSSMTLEYSMTDFNVPNTVVYYRLKQTDFDGVYKYYDIRSVDNRSGEREIIGIYTIQGQKVQDNFIGLRIVHYLNGDIEKKFGR